MPEASGYRAIYSRSLLRKGRYAAFAIAVLSALASIAHHCLELSDEVLLQSRDLVQDYLMARAIRAGVDPYQPLPELSERFLGHSAYMLNSVYATPHTPAAGLLMLPFSWLPLWYVSVLWLLISVLCGLWAVNMVVRSIDGNRSRPVLAIFVWSLLIISYAGTSDMVWGQFNYFLLLLAAGSWRLLSAGAPFRAGTLMGVCFALKFFGWPLAIFYLVKGRARFAAGFLCSSLLILSAATMVIGTGPALKYVEQVLPAVNRLWSKDPANYSLYSAAARLIEPPRVLSKPEDGLVVKARIVDPGPLPGGRFDLCLLLSLTLVGLTILVAGRKEGEWRAFSSLLAISTAANPVSWDHYAVMLTLALSVSVAEFASGQRGRSLKSWALVAAGAALLFVNFPGLFWQLVADWVPVDTVVQMPAALAAVCALPALLILGIAILL